MSRTSHSASALLVNAVVHFGRGLLGGAVAPSVVAMLDQLLLRKRDKEAVAERA